MEIYELDKKSPLAHDIALIHKEAFPHFFLTQLGTGFLTTLYQGYIEDTESGIIVAKEDDQIIGFIAYSKDYSRFFSELKKNHIVSFAMSSLIAVIKKPSYFKRLFRALKKSDEVKRTEKYVELASIGVIHSAQGFGIGGKLINYIKSMVDFSVYEYVNLETDADNNDDVNTFYKNKGFVLYREYVTPEGRRMNEYRYNPTPEESK